MRMAIRVVAVLVLIVSLGFGVFNAYALATPTEEHEFADTKAKEAARKAEEAKASRDAAERSKLEQEALDLMTSARLWAEGGRDRHATHKLGLALCVGGVLVGVVLFVLTRRRMKTSSSPR